MDAVHAGGAVGGCPFEYRPAIDLIAAHVVETTMSAGAVFLPNNYARTVEWVIECQRDRRPRIWEMVAMERKIAAAQAQGGKP